MAKRQPKPSTLRIIFQPWKPTDDASYTNQYEEFAGDYFLDALNPDGTLIERGYRATVPGCTTCRRDYDNPTGCAHVTDLTDIRRQYDPKAARHHCQRWKTVEAIVKQFGGWRRVQYIELPEHAGLVWEPVPSRVFTVKRCDTCDGRGIVRTDKFGQKGHVDEWFTTCVDCGGGWRRVPLEGPLPTDRFRSSQGIR